MSGVPHADSVADSLAISRQIQTSQHPKGHRSPPGILLENLVTYRYKVQQPTHGWRVGRNGRSGRIGGSEVGTDVRSGSGAVSGGNLSREKESKNLGSSTVNPPHYKPP